MADVSSKAIGLFVADSDADIGDGTSATWVAGRTWWFDTTAMLLKVWDGVAWVSMGGGGAGAGTFVDYIEVVFDGNGEELGTGIKLDIEIPFDCTITQATLLADQTGSIVIDVWKDVYANYPPTDADSITASAPPTISSGVKSRDSTLTGWTTAVTAGDTFRFNIDSVTNITRATLSLRITRVTFDCIEAVFDGNGAVLTTGVKLDVEIPFSCIINRATLIADQTGSIVIDIWKDTYANYPPTDADSITASAPPTISSATKSQDSTLTGWTTAIIAGDVLRFNIDSVTTITRVALSLKVTRS